MTLLVRLGEGRGREGCLFHKTVDMHFSTGCFSFTLCSKKKTVSKAEIWVSLQEEKKKKKGATSMQPAASAPRRPCHTVAEPTTGRFAATCPHTCQKKKNRPAAEGPQVGLPTCVPRGYSWAWAKGVQAWAPWGAQSLASGQDLLLSWSYRPRYCKTGFPIRILKNRISFQNCISKLFY